MTQAEAEAIFAKLIETSEAKNIVGNTVLPDSPQFFILTMKATATLTLPKAVKGVSITIYTIQDASGSRIITWQSPTGTLRWPEGSVPTNTSLANGIDVWTFVCGDGTNWDGAVPMLNMK